MKAQVLDQGQFFGGEWKATEGGSFQLYVDGVYIACISGLRDDTHLIVVSTDHKVELRGDA